jgi:hypothetical protein
MTAARPVIRSKNPLEPPAPPVLFRRRNTVFPSALFTEANVGVSYAEEAPNDAEEALSHAGA